MYEIENLKILNNMKIKLNMNIDIKMGLIMKTWKIKLYAYLWGTNELFPKISFISHHFILQKYLSNFFIQRDSSRFLKPSPFNGYLDIHYASSCQLKSKLLCEMALIHNPWSWYPLWHLLYLRDESLTRFFTFSVDN